MANKTALITGYTGQDGTWLTQFLLRKGYTVLGMGRRISTEPPRRVRGKFDFSADIRDGALKLVEGDLESTTSLHHILSFYRPDEIYNLAAQSHVGTSFKQPENTINTNFLGVVNLLETVELIEDYSPRIYQASTSEMFGNRNKPESFHENSRFNPESPYAIAKLAAHNYCRMKRDQGMFVSCGILFNHESEIRGGDFVTQKIARGAVDIMAAYQNLEDIPVLELGNLDSGRDWGHAEDYVRGMWMMLQADRPEDFVLSTGITETVRRFVECSFMTLGESISWEGSGTDEIGKLRNGETVVKINPKYYRPNDVNYLNGISLKAKNKLGWTDDIKFPRLVERMIKAAQEARHASISD